MGDLLIFMYTVNNTNFPVIECDSCRHFFANGSESDKVLIGNDTRLFECIHMSVFVVVLPMLTDNEYIYLFMCMNARVRLAVYFIRNVRYGRSRIFHNKY